MATNQEAKFMSNVVGGVVEGGKKWEGTVYLIVPLDFGICSFFTFKAVGNFSVLVDIMFEMSESDSKIQLQIRFGIKLNKIKLWVN